MAPYLRNQLFMENGISDIFEYKKETMTNGAGQSFLGHTRCRVVVDIGALGKVLMIIHLYAARISEGKRFPLSLSHS